MTKRLLTAAVLLVLLLTRGPVILTIGAHNLAAGALMGPLVSASHQLAFPPCGEGAEASAARRYLSPDLAQEREALVSRGWIAWLEGDCAAAEAMWDRACTGEPSERVALFCLRLFLSGEGEMGGVPQGGLSPASMAGQAYAFGRWAEGEEEAELAAFAYEVALNLLPDRSAAGRLAYLLRRDGRVEEAAAVWDRVAAALPLRDAEAWWAMGQAAGLRQDWGQAAWAYGRGAALAEEPYAFWMERGRALQRRGKWEEAELAYRRALAARPDHYLAYLDLGQVYFQQGEDLQALRWFAAALEIRPDHPSSNVRMAQVLHRMGEEGQAVVFLARAVELHGGEPWTWAMQLGDWRLELGDRRGALAAYRRALGWRPGEAALVERVERLRGRR
jgi:tetratricopeptide (TPR) repeat protein